MVARRTMPMSLPSSKQRFAGQPQPRPNRVAVERADTEPVEPDLDGTEQHALHGDAQIDVDPAVFGHRRTDDDEGVGFRARQRQMQFGQRTAHADVRQHPGSLVRQHEPEAQYLLVARRRDFRTDGDDAAELVRPHDEPGVVTAHAAVPGQQPFQRRRPTRLRRRLRPISLHSSFEIVVRHRFFFFRFDRSIHLQGRPAGRPPPRRVYSSPAGGSVRTIPLLERPSI